MRVFPINLFSDQYIHSSEVRNCDLFITQFYFLSEDAIYPTDFYQNSSRDDLQTKSYDWVERSFL